MEPGVICSSSRMSFAKLALERKLRGDAASVGLGMKVMGPLFVPNVQVKVSRSYLTDESVV